VKTWNAVLVSAMVALSVLSADYGICEEKQIIRVSGALPLSDLVSGWAADFMKGNPNVQIAVIGKTAGYGYTQLTEGKADLAMATRKMTEEERRNADAKGIRIGEKLIMSIPVAIITGAHNPVNSLTMDQLRDIYSGGISNWREVGGPDQPIKVLQRPYPDTGVAVLFKDLVLKDRDYRKDAMVMATFKNMVLVCEQSMGIGHIPSTAAFCDPSKYQIKLLELKKDANSQAVQLKHPDYPLKMDFFLVWNSATTRKEVQDFVRFSSEKAKEAK
jgi:phosphate transport system substrate-binding protein